MYKKLSFILATINLFSIPNIGHKSARHNNPLFDISDFQNNEFVRANLTPDIIMREYEQSRSYIKKHDKEWIVKTKYYEKELKFPVSKQNGGTRAAIEFYLSGRFEPYIFDLHNFQDREVWCAISNKNNKIAYFINEKSANLWTKMGSIEAKRQFVFFGKTQWKTVSPLSKKSYVFSNQRPAMQYLQTGTFDSYSYISTFNRKEYYCSIYLYKCKTCLETNKYEEKWEQFIIDYFVDIVYEGVYGNKKILTAKDMAKKFSEFGIFIAHSNNRYSLRTHNQQLLGTCLKGFCRYYDSAEDVVRNYHLVMSKFKN